MQKRFLTALVSGLTGIVIAAGSLLPIKADALTFSPNTSVSSKAAILYNMDIGTVVYEKDANRRESPAALAQIMTAVVVLENCADISTEKITADTSMFSQFVDYKPQSDLRYAGINAGDTLTVEDLLYAMMLTSSCEASIMLATHFGSGSESAFVDLMNDKAAALGMTNTRFTNATGLYSARQVSTARDLMTLLDYAMKMPRFETIACATSYTPPSAAALNKTEKWAWTHSNDMYATGTKFYCNGVRGIKTGNLEDGGRSIACKASRDGNNYLLICLNSPMSDAKGKNYFYHQEDAKNILEWAFAHLSYQEIINTKTEFKEVKVLNAEGDDYVILKPKADFSCIWCDTADVKNIQQIIDAPKETEAPVNVGDKLGTVTLKLAGETLAQIDLVASSAVERSFWKYNLNEMPGFFKSIFLKRTWIVALILSLLYIGLCIFFAVRFRIARNKHMAAKAARARMQNRQ